MNKLKKYILTNDNFVSNFLTYLYLIVLSDSNKSDIVIKKNNIDLTRFIKDDLIRVKTYIDISEKNNGICDDVYNLLLSVNDDKVKFMFIDKLIDDDLKFEVIKTIKDENIRLESLTYINDNLYRYRIASEFKEPLNIKKALNLMTPLNKASLISLIDDDNYKISKLNEFIEIFQVIIIASLKNDDLKKQYVYDPKYYKYVQDILVSIKDNGFIINYFKNCDDINLKYKVIAKTENENLRKSLISLTDTMIYKKIKETNDSSYIKNALDSVDVSYINFDIDRNITFGVELETTSLSHYGAASINKFFNNWKISREIYIPSGVEFISPVFNYNEESLKEICWVCDFLKKNHFITNEFCGGHIHFGFKYFENRNHFRVFLKLYSSVEDILYIISNKEGTKPREIIEKHAKSIHSIISSSEEYVKRWRFTTLNQYTNLVKGLENDRYYSLNLKNIFNPNKNTIEYRIPNGEIDFTELNANIRLIAKMMEKSKEISESIYGKGNNKQIVSKYRDILIEEDVLQRLYLLLDILFDTNQDKDIYINRYNINKELVNVKSLIKKRI